MTAPFWFQHFGAANQVLLAVLGLVVLILTIREKLLDAKLKRAQLRALMGVKNANSTAE